MTTIPNSTVTILGAAATLCFILPLLVLVAYKKNTRARLRPCIYGILIFLAFAGALEQMVHMLFLGLDTPISRFLASSPWGYAIYGGLAAGLFEETGRFFAVRMLKKEEPDGTTPIMYGIGHGGAEAILLGALSLLNAMILATSINAMGTDVLLEQAGEAAATIEATINSLINTPPTMYFVSAFERAVAFALQISLSVLVFFSVMKPELRFLFPLSILLHFLLDVLAGLFQTGMITNVYLLEAIILLYTLGVAYFARSVYRKHIEA